MKPAVIAAIMLAFGIHLAPRCEAKEEATEITHCANQQQPRALAMVFAFAVHANQQGSASCYDKGQNDSPNGDETAQWILIGITGITAGFICWQAWETRKAAQATQQSAERMAEQTGILKESVGAAKDAATAAKASANISVGVSLPTLVVHEFDTGEAGAANLEAVLQFPTIKLAVKNYGQTPALLHSWTVIFTCEKLPDAPVYFGYPGSGMVFDKVAIPSNGEHLFPRIPTWNRQEFSADDVKAIINRNKILRVYGYVAYGDIFGSPLRRMKFCETAINFFEGDAKPIGWFDQMCPLAYMGIDQYPVFGANSGTEASTEQENPN